MQILPALTPNTIGPDSPEVVLALGSPPPAKDDVQPSRATDAHYRAAERFIAFSKGLEKFADDIHLTELGRHLKRKQLAQETLDGLDGLKGYVAKSQETLSEVTARIDKVFADVDPAEVRHWSGFWQSVSGSPERMLKAREAIEQGDTGIAVALLRAPRVLALLEDSHRQELRDLLAGSLAPRSFESEQRLSREVRAAQQALEGLERTCTDTIRQADLEAKIAAPS